jgi:trk system potassium uptake protein TrkH
MPFRGKLRMDRERVFVWLSRAMFFVAGVAAVSLILEYGFYLSTRAREWLHLIDLLVVGLFVADASLRFSLSRQRISHLKFRWPALAIGALVLVQLLLVNRLRGTGWLPFFFEERGLFSLAKGYIIVLQAYLIFLIVGQAVAANRRIASLRIRPARTVMLSFLIIIVIGTFLLCTPKATVHGIRPVDALFTATSAVCVTGLSVVDTGTHFTRFGQAIILALIQIGGLGLITLTAFFAVAMRRTLGLQESVALRGMVTYGEVGRMGRTLGSVIGITLLLETAGAIVLLVATRPDFGTARAAVWTSVFHSISAFCNAGFSLHTTNLERYVGNIPVTLTITTLIILGGLGFPVIMNALGHRVLADHPSRCRTRWGIHSRLVLGMTVVLLVVGTLGFFLLERDGALAGRPLGEKLLASYFGSVTARTAGFNTVRTGFLSLPTLFMLTALMFIGGSPGGTAGGVKTSTFGIVLATINAMLRGKGRVELMKRRIPDRVVNESLVVVAAAIFVITAATFLLLVSEKTALSDTLFEVVSAFGTVGLSTGITPILSPLAKVALVLVMLTGRIGPLTLVLAIGQRHVRHSYDYPEETVLVG